jgi:Cytochrome b5-like Heme/Steroid binding domain
MSATEELTYAEVSSHSSKKDLYVVIHDKVYNASSFVDEHPYAIPIPFDPFSNPSLHSQLPGITPLFKWLTTRRIDEDVLADYCILCVGAVKKSS